MGNTWSYANKYKQPKNKIPDWYKKFSFESVMTEEFPKDEFFYYIDFHYNDLVLEEILVKMYILPRFVNHLHIKNIVFIDLFRNYIKSTSMFLLLLY